MTTFHYERVLGVISSCEFNDWTFDVKMSTDRVYINARWIGQDNFLKDGNVNWQHSRRWLIREDASKSEIVQTAFACVLQAMEHEIREQFLFNGRAVFGPHHDVDTLWAISEHMEPAHG